MAHGKHEVRREKKDRKKRVIGLFAWTLALVLPAGIGVGYAGWGSSGTGSGEAKATTAVSLTVAPGAASSQLYPGATGDVKFSVTNPNTYPVTVTGWTAASVTGTDKAGCTAAHFTLNTGTIAAPGVAAGATSTVTVTGGIAMTAAAPDACQGAAVTVNATLSAASA
jgi:hypothetical protein